MNERKNKRECTAHTEKLREKKMFKIRKHNNNILVNIRSSANDAVNASESVAKLWTNKRKQTHRTQYTNHILNSPSECSAHEKCFKCIQPTQSRREKKIRACSVNSTYTVLLYCRCCCCCVYTELSMYNDICMYRHWFGSTLFEIVYRANVADGAIATSVAMLVVCNITQNMVFVAVAVAVARSAFDGYVHESGNCVFLAHTFFMPLNIFFNTM